MSTCERNVMPFFAYTLEYYVSIKMSSYYIKEGRNNNIGFIA